MTLGRSLCIFFSLFGRDHWVHGRLILDVFRGVRRAVATFGEYPTFWKGIKLIIDRTRLGVRPEGGGWRPTSD